MAMRIKGKWQMEKMQGKFLQGDKSGVAGIRATGAVETRRVRRWPGKGKREGGRALGLGVMRNTFCGLGARSRGTKWVLRPADGLARRDGGARWPAGAKSRPLSQARRYHCSVGSLVEWLTRSGR